MVLRATLSALAAAAVVLVTGLLLVDCGSLGVQGLCEDYAAKRVSCGIIAASQEQAEIDDCVTLLDAGADEARYRCQVDTPCAEIAAQCPL